MKKIILITLLCIFVLIQGYTQYETQVATCNTPPLKSEWLVKFQQNLDAYDKTDDVFYVPITLHSVGNDEGEGHIPVQTALDKLCELNQFFEEADLHFFLEGNIHYIDNSIWFQGEQAVNMMTINNVDSTINCYIIGGDLDGFAYYSTTGDAINLPRQFLIGASHIFAHEVGHYLSLPHTFWGWENTTWNFSTPAPEFVGGRKVERVDGIDCEIAGDGFCDTPPDYLSGFIGGYFCNFNVESYIIQTDPVGAIFQTDCSLIMSYAQSPYRFSDQQINAMRANIEQVRPYLLDNQNPLPDLNAPEVTLTNPIQGSMVSPDESVSLEWEPVPDASHYLVEITFLSVFSAVYEQFVVSTNSLVFENLLPEKTYRWRVLPFNTFHSCSPYSQEGLFNTGEQLDCDYTKVIGMTVYDLQTNGSVCNRLSQDADGNIMATWTMSLDPLNGFADRGTGYNRFDASTGNWGSIPTQRLEQNTRTGWPNHIVTDSGVELIVNHVFTGQGVFLHTFRRESESADWTEGFVPTNTLNGNITARMVSSGETIHIIAPATPLSFGGTVYEGVDGHILYYRSQDGGSTWDIIDGVIPGLDNTFMADLGRIDSYAIDSRGEVVAAGVFSSINDVRLFKSNDGGSTWTHTRVSDFPLEKYQTDQGYTLNDLPPPTAQQPDPLAIFTSDNSGSVLVDRNEKIHVFYGQTYIKDTDTQDGRIINFPNTSGIAYWNESFGPDSVRTIADVLDLNGNQIIDIDPGPHLADYFVSMTTYPSPAVDENNHMYLAYSSVMEGAEYRQNFDARHFRHILIVHSDDGGNNWSQPYDAINAMTQCDPHFPLYVEAVYPSMVRDVENEIMFLYQYDFRPGFSFGYQPETNFIGFANIPLSEFGVVETEELTPSSIFQLIVSPNPANNQINIQLPGNSSRMLEARIYDIRGRQLSNQTFVKGQSIQIDNFPDGLYIVKVSDGRKHYTGKFVKHGNP